MTPKPTIKIREFQDESEARIALEKLGVHKQGIDIMAPKSIFKIFEISGLSPMEASFLKQGILSKGGECALSMSTYTTTEGMVTVLMMGTHQQLRELGLRMRSQPFGLKYLPVLGQVALTSYDKPMSLLLQNGKKMRLGSSTKIMGVLNVTPDSFSDGGEYFDKDTAVNRGIQMVKEGAHILDIGGQSTRPGSDPVTSAEEAERVIPVIKELAKKVKVPISIDTYDVEVAKEALKAGASMINDVNGLRSEGMMELAGKTKVPVFIMHMKGTPKNMQKDPSYDDCIKEISEFLRNQAQAAIEAGVDPGRIVLDPGIGFGKRLEDNLLIIKRLREFRSLGYPVLIGTSRKSFIGMLTKEEAGDRLEGTLASVTLAAQNGADIVRVHDVKEARSALKVADAVRNVKEA